MSPKETKALLEFTDQHNCMKGCEGCIGESKNGCVHPDHPLMNSTSGQALNTTSGVTAHALS